MKKKIILSFVIIALIILCMYCGNVIYKYNIFKSIQKEIEVLNNKDNYKLSLTYENGYLDVTYKKGNVVQEIFYEEGKEKLLLWENDETMFYRTSGGELKEDNQFFNPRKLYLSQVELFDEYTNKVLLNLALNPFNVVNVEKIGNQEFIKIKFDTNEIVYFNKDTKIPVFSINSNGESSLAENKNISSVIFKYEVDVVTADDFIKTE